MLPTTRRLVNSPFAVLREMDRALNHAWTEIEGTDQAGFAVDIREVDDKLIFEADLPGFAKEQIDIHVEQGVLTIEANRTDEQAAQTPGQTHLHERRQHHVVRRFSLPSAYNTDQVEASLANGVLTLTLPKREEVKPKKIQVK